MRRNTMAAAAVLGIVALAGGCSDAPTGERMAPTAPLLASTGSTLIECPTSETRTATETLDIFGGTVELDGHSITLPYGAVLVPTEITLTVPASNYMEIEIRANDQDSFDFEEPVSIVLSYERCTRSNIEKGDLTAWEIEPETKALLVHMGGVDDKTARTVTFESWGLSGFAIAD